MKRAEIEAENEGKGEESAENLPRLAPRKKRRSGRTDRLIRLKNSSDRLIETIESVERYRNAPRRYNAARFLNARLYDTKTFFFNA